MIFGQTPRVCLEENRIPPYARDPSAPDHALFADTRERKDEARNIGLGPEHDWSRLATPPTHSA
jgi:hypothetical protein